MGGNRRFGRRSTTGDVLAGLDLGGKSMLVTGSNAGIGLETARSLAAHGVRVHLGCRSAGKADATAAAIREHHPEADLVPFVCDLGSFASVRQAAEGFTDAKLDALILNAGLYGGAYAETADGFERTVGVCHLGHFLLTMHLLPRLEAATSGRLVVVSSESHRSPRRLDFDRLPLPRNKYREMVAYGQAKLCNVLFANEFQRRYADRGLTANSLHPGALIPTAIARYSKLAKAALAVARPFTKSIEQGAATTVYVATAPELAGVGGRYFSNCGEKTASAEARDPQVAARLWSVTEAWVGLKS